MKAKKIESLWSHVHWLGVLASMGSYTAAAQRLGVSKAAVSHRIAELEAAACVQLVQRTTRSVRLSEAGQQLVDATRASFAEIERSFAGIRDLAQAPQGLLRVTAPVALGRQQIVPLLPAFLRQFPGIRIELEVSDRLASLAQEGFDLAIRHVSSVPDTHVAWKLCETRTVLVAVRSYLRRRGLPAAPADLAGHNCLHYLRSGDTPVWSFEPARGKGARLSIAVQGSFAANNSELLREAALGGVGIALLPDFSAKKEIEAGRFVPILPGWRSVGAFGEHLYAIRPYSAHVPRAVSALVSYLRGAMQGGFGSAGDLPAAGQD
ncbi:MAG: LysR family transcriptional regulator [Burkholderiales bacterium]|nr:LysR family transcriptional regulator [Burkholderiales bacterium]MDE2398154.1 LysR family transcriptional regulator [Burkholderiales bacterium]